MGKFNQTYIKAFLERFPYENWAIDVDDVRDEWLDFFVDDVFSPIPGEQQRPLHEIFGGLITDEEYQKCMIKALMDFNQAVVSTSYSPVNFPWPLLWIKKSFVQVLSQVVAFHAANAFATSSGGVSVDLHAQRMQTLSAIRATIAAETKETQDKIKIDINNDMAYGDFLPAGGYGGWYFG
jgi:hypothetical protein